MIPKSVTKTIGDITFDDPYAHLHEDTAEALAWQWEQDEMARQAAQASPNYESVRKRLLSVRPGDRFALAPVMAGGRWFSIGKHEGELAVLVQNDLTASARIIDTAAAIAARSGVNNALLFGVAPSPHGTYLAVAYLLDGATISPWGVYEVASGRPLFATPPQVHLHSQPAWLPDESGFWLGGHTKDGLHRQRFHPVAPGAAERPEIVVPESLAGAMYPTLTAQMSPDGRRAILVSEPHEHIAVALLDFDTRKMRTFLPEGWQGECDGTWADDATYIARVNGDAARGRIVAIPIASSQDASTWRELVPAGEGFVAWAGLVAGRLYVADMVDVSMRIRVFDLDGRPLETLPLKAPCAIPSMMVSRSIRPTEGFAFLHTTFTQSAALMMHDPKSGVLKCVRAAEINLDAVDVERRFATSRDGARIPYFVVRRGDVDATRPQPTLVHAYGGFNVSLLPDFPSLFVPFIEAGGVFVHASLRGGGEYGRDWHDAGRLKHKQNTFDDLAAVARALIDEGISTPAQMAFQGTSNGGLLAGVAIVQQPYLWRAVAPDVPLLDIMEAFAPTPETAAARAVLYDDYGDPSDPEQAKVIYAWSPYHNIVEGLAYPAVYQTFGENDPACRPFHGRKFTARLRAADTSGRPIHLRVWRNTGHMVTEPIQAAAYVSEWLSFVMDQVGLRYLAHTHSGTDA